MIRQNVLNFDCASEIGKAYPIEGKGIHDMSGEFVFIGVSE